MYANKEIKSENGEPLKIGIFDSANLNVPVSTDKLSSAPVELFLEDGEHKEISKSDNGKPLMFGDLQFNLQSGIGEEKHHPPNWDDAINRLEGVGDKYKNILSSLQPHPINTVGDFLVAHDFGRGAIVLKQILGIKSADNKWDKIVKHAMECDDPRAINYVLHFHQNFGGDDHAEKNQNVNDQNLEFNQQNQNQNDDAHPYLPASSNIELGA
ncbi:calmodulin-binding protein 60 A-like [Cucumis melo var. makuwa]|uniref:Calmodulin-binding protein 60 A-like n=1 Tax=Cucumis melo var. makuwa TaxID=1194695 RepID=A0A5A7TEC6_CUCMM|nr:calmodulin-binding protein 60 A-like [Cucumis melo var. makuwa]TYK02758.1 calmodulin-binding protein 60 A-like [Cucumis melo var. makuwa]